MKKRIPIINPGTYVFTFGKWRGENYLFVPESYIQWCIENVNEFVVSKEEKKRISNFLLREERPRMEDEGNVYLIHPWDWYE